jgi:hypothetical protein
MGRSHLVFIQKLFGHISSLEMSLLEEAHGYACGCHSIQQFVMPKHCLFPVS